MDNKITITFNDGSTNRYPLGATVGLIATEYQAKMENPIIGAKINNEVVTFNYAITKDVAIDFFDVNDLNGYKMYQGGLKFVLIVALRELYGNKANVIFEHSIDKGIMCTITNGKPITETETAELKQKMQEIIEQDLPIEKLNITKKEAIFFYETVGEIEKAKNIQNINNSLVVLYRLKDSYNYFYVDMPQSTGVLTKFDLINLSVNKTVLMFPSPRSNNEVPLYNHNEKIVEVFKEDKEWTEKMNVQYVSEFNEQVGQGNISEFIRINELVFNNKIDRLVTEVMNNKNIRLLLISGPSSSGKTTTTKKMMMSLKAHGHNTLMMSVDDYFKERVDSPKDENGEYDFECLEAIDLELFNKHLKQLLNGEEVVIPTFDFLIGEKVYDRKPIKIDDDTIILIEGLHCLNEELTKEVPRESKYKVYLSPFTPLSIDRHNHVSTVDMRMLRRMVRDNRTRGAGVSSTIKHWQNVRRGEEKYIFPYIPEADAVLNTALVYEIGVLKVYAEPLLYSVEVTSPYYEEARRLLGFLKNFFPIPSEYVVDNSILREFIGQSFFE